MPRSIASPAAARSPGATRHVQDPLRSFELSPGRRRLASLLRQVHFGRIEHLVVRGGEPVFDPAPGVRRTLKIAGRNEPRPAPDGGDYLLKGEVLELLEHLARLGDGVVERIEVAHGLPLLLEVRETLSADPLPADSLPAEPLSA